MKNLLNYLGFGLIITGIVLSILSGNFCEEICNNCSSEQNSPCFFLIILSGIMFVVSGASAILNNSKLGNNSLLL